VCVRGGARGAPRDQIAVPRFDRALHLHVGAGVQAGCCDAQDGGQQDLGVPERLGDAGRLQGRPPFLDQGGRGATAQTRTSSFKASAWKWAEIGSITGSRSPSRISGSRWIVRLTRWSVSRFCGKL
jgi:hypothetical protein